MRHRRVPVRRLRRSPHGTGVVVRRAGPARDAPSAPDPDTCARLLWGYEPCGRPVEVSGDRETSCCRVRGGWTATPGLPLRSRYHARCHRGPERPAASLRDGTSEARSRPRCSRCTDTTWPAPPSPLSFMRRKAVTLACSGCHVTADPGLMWAGLLHLMQARARHAPERTEACLRVGGWMPSAMAAWRHVLLALGTTPCRSPRTQLVAVRPRGSAQPRGAMVAQPPGMVAQPPGLVVEVVVARPRVEVAHCPAAEVARPRALAEVERPRPDAEHCPVAEVMRPREVVAPPGPVAEGRASTRTSPSAAIELPRTAPPGRRSPRVALAPDGQSE